MKKLLIFIILGFICLFDTAFAVTYHYDGMDRITQVDYGSGSFVRYSYDAEGNITQYISQKIILFGDINNDTSISLEDAMVILRVNSRMEVTEEILLKADLDGDQKISHTELLHVLQKISNLRQ